MPFWAPWAQALAGYDRTIQAKNQLGRFVCGLDRIQRAKRPMLIGGLCDGRNA
jgi:hypothetical protein